MTDKETKSCSDCIHYDLCYKIEHYGRDLEDTAPCKQFIDTSNVVEVVRCKDCKHCVIVNSYKCFAICLKLDFTFKPFEIDTRTHFCSYGERRE